MKLGDFLTKAGISERQFGAQIGVSQAAVNRYVRGHRIPRRDVIDKIARVTDGAVTVVDFFGPMHAPAEAA